MTPLAIEIMIECYRCALPGANIPPNIWSSPAAKEERENLIRLGLIRSDDLRATMLGEAYIGALMATPVPEPECEF
jgi:hypothetical protein